ncbi:hypothetical protein [Palleronia sp.]|uniref:hypothetical protein n=1 Tax=Palleronia sp. TaxID=1940284 RepID=UPI0035C7CC82
MSALRLPCIVPGCHRTIGQRKGKPPIQVGDEWICGRHWQGVPKAKRQRLARYRRRAKRDPRWRRPFWKMWDRCKDAAIQEAFMGIEL